MSPKIKDRHQDDTVVILTALSLEFQALRTQLSGIRPRLHPAGTLFEEGFLPRVPCRIALATVGEGNIGAGSDS